MKKAILAIVLLSFSVSSQARPDDVYTEMTTHERCMAWVLHNFGYFHPFEYLKYVVLLDNIDL